MSGGFNNERGFSTSTINLSQHNVEQVQGNVLTFKQPTEWQERWFLSSNAKDIGTLYLIFVIFSGLLGTAFSVIIRMELSGPGVQYIADNQLYNSIITAVGLVWATRFWLIILPNSGELRGSVY